MDYSLFLGDSRSFYDVPQSDVVALTFHFSTYALLGAALFFLMERKDVPKRWRTNVTVAGVICLVAGTSYIYMQGMYSNLRVSPTQFRYIDWLFTVPLMCTQFYLLMWPSGASLSSLVRLFVSGVWMIGFGYFGELSSSYWSVFWGALSTLGYMAVIHEIWFGPLSKLADDCPDEEVVQAFTYMSYFILVGWAIYPLGYMTMPFNVFESLHLDRNLVYNFGDVINKVGFGLVMYTMARKSARRKSVAQKANRRKNVWTRKTRLPPRLPGTKPDRPAATTGLAPAAVRPRSGRISLPTKAKWLAVKWRGMSYLFRPVQKAFRISERSSGC